MKVFFVSAATQPPATQPPATQPPATQPPATQPPATQPPATQPPATQPPATQPPVTQPTQEHQSALLKCGQLLVILYIQTVCRYMYTIPSRCTLLTKIYAIAF